MLCYIPIAHRSSFIVSVRADRSRLIESTSTSMPDQPDPKFTILYFAAASTFTNRSSERLPAPLPIRSLFSKLESRYPGITTKVLKSCAVTVNLEYVDLDDDSNDDSISDGAARNEDKKVIQAGDEVGIIPPVSSG